jgi:hypothetical protein
MAGGLKGKMNKVHENDKNPHGTGTGQDLYPASSFSRNATRFSAEKFQDQDINAVRGTA